MWRRRWGWLVGRRDDDDDDGVRVGGLLKGGGVMGRRRGKEKGKGGLGFLG